MSAETLSNVKFVQEKRLLSSFFDQISQDTGKYVFGIKDTMACLEMGAVETLIVWENLETMRYVFTNPTTGGEDIKYLVKEQETESAHFKDKDSGADLDVVDKQPLLEWLASNYKKFGCALEFVTNRSQEGSQFCRGFGGIGGVLRYSVDTAEFEGFADDDDNEDAALWSEEENFF